MNEDLKKSLVGFCIGLIFLIYSFLSQYIKDNKSQEPVTKKEKISKGIKNVIYVGYVTRGIVGIIFILISLFFLLRYLVS